MPNKKRPSLLILVGLPLAVIVLLWSVLNPPAPPAAKGGKTTAAVTHYTYEKAVAEQDKTTSELKQMVTAQASLPAKLGEMAYDLPAEQLRPRVIRDLLQTASKAGVHITEFKSLRPVLLASKQVARVPLEVRFRAAFQPNVVEFLYYLEDPKNKVVVDKLNITSAQNNRFKTVDVTTQVSVFTRSTAGVGAEGDTGNAVASNDRG